MSFFNFLCRLFALHRFFLLYHTLCRSWSSNGKNAEFTKVHWKSYALCRKVVWKSCNFDKNSLEKMWNLPKVPWKNRMGAKIGWKITCHFCLCFIVFCFYENNGLIKKLFLPCAGWPLQINLLQFNKSFRRQSAVRDIGRPRSATKIQRKMLTWVKQT